ncbi:Major pollen allergen Aln g 1 [Linum grandiflorum]
MAIFSFEAQVSTSIEPARIFKAFVLDGEKIASQIFPEAIKSVSSEGDGGPGTIKQVHFNEGSPFKYVKEVVDELDKEKFVYGYTVIGGDALMRGVEKISYRITMEESADGGTNCKRTSKFFTAENGGAIVGEEEINAAQDGIWQMFVGIFKAFEDYLLANPTS